MPTSGQPMFERAASSVISGAGRLLTPVTPQLPRPILSVAERREAEDAVKAGALCLYCAGIHAGPSSPACPRLASGKLNGDGTVVEFSFWRDGEWDTSRVVFAADIEDEGEDEEPGAE